MAYVIDLHCQFLHRSKDAIGSLVRAKEYTDRPIIVFIVTVVMDHQIPVTGLVIAEQAVHISLSAFIGNRQAHGNRQMGYPPAAGFDEVLRRDKSAFIIIGHYFRRSDAIAYPIEKYERDIPLL